MKSIRGRLTILLLGGLALALGAGGAAVYWISEASLVRQFDAGLKSRAHTLASLVKLEPEGLIFENGDAPPAMMAETYFELRLGSSGNVLKKSAKLGDLSLPQCEVAENEYVTANTDLPGSLNGRAVWFGFRARVDPDDWGNAESSQASPELLTIVAALDRGPIDRALGTLLTTLLMVGLSVAIAVAILVALGIRWGLAPIDRLSRQLGRVSGTTLSERFDNSGAPRELAPVYRELNGMLDRMEQTLERERSFADGAAHELRTPLAELRAAAEVAIKWPEAKPAMVSLNQVLQIGHEMEQLVESLLLISRGNTADGSSHLKQAAMGSIVQGCLVNARDAINQKRLQLVVEVGNGELFPAPAPAVEIIARNLIDNAVQYTPAGGNLTIRTENSGDHSTALVVENGPVELAQSDLPRLFEPFWRMDRARSDRRHVGLGLTVVHRIATTMGMRIETELRGDQLQIRVCAENSIAPR
ncbi:MAG: HAMP domain-containing histidine kinase [Phycisphaerales bacterium]|nr:HAMP domain-containing histidine kinase [Phycisphaerales bacterium]MCI0676053.1 HAMP domain-containing histidine kinase [Phycisphaerales bacterium]